MKAVLMMGIPGAGKSTWVRKNLPGRLVLNVDDTREALPGYDPANPGALHAEAVAHVEEQLAEAIAAGRDFVFDGCGVQTERYLRLVSDLHAAGYMVMLCYVRCSLEMARERVRDRERAVPEAVLEDRAARIEGSFKRLSAEVDEVQIVDGTQ